VLNERWTGPFFSALKNFKRHFLSKQKIIFIFQIYISIALIVTAQPYYRALAKKFALEIV